jgi:hypothetical protein
MGPTDPGGIAAVAAGAFGVGLVTNSCGAFVLALFIDADGSASCTDGDPVWLLEGYVFGFVTLPFTPDSITPDGSVTAGSCESFGPGYHLRLEQPAFENITGCKNATVRVIDTTANELVAAYFFPSWQDSVSEFRQGALIAGHAYDVYTYVDSDGVAGCTSGDAKFHVSVPPVTGPVTVTLPGAPSDDSVCAFF